MNIATTSLLRGALLGALGTFALVVGCQGQGEGERCSLLNQNHDCVGELVCTAASRLKLEDGVDRCCPEDLTEADDDRCQPRIGGGSGTGGSTGTGGGSSGPGGEGGAQAGLNDACHYRSDCVEPLVCGPTGHCQPECQDDIDCDDGLVCTSAQRCEEP
jgi:hypothetical protein